MKKTFGCLVCLVLVLLCAAAFAASAGKCGGQITWTLENGRLTLEGTGPMEDGTAWRGTIQAGEIRRLVVGEGITAIGAKAFSDCKNLSDVSLPETLEKIGEEAFLGCDSLKAMKLPDRIRELSTYCFSEATKKFVLSGLKTETGNTLGSWDIPFSIPGDPEKYIYAYSETGVYLGLTLFEPLSLTAEQVVFPEGTETIREGFFEGMKNLKSARIPATVRSLSIASFAGVYRQFYIECEKGSYAEQFALEQGLQFDNGERKVIGWDIRNSAEKVKWIVSNYIRPGMSEKQKARILHNWLINNSHYDIDKEIRDERILLTEGYGVCEAYAYCYYELLKEAGMAVCILSGEAKASQEGHAWNVIRINGRWYHVDTTWDDPGMGPKEYPCISGQERMAYFLLPDKEMARDHAWESYQSADRGRIWKYYDPAQGKDIFLITSDGEFVYYLNWKKKTAQVVSYLPDIEKMTLEIPAKFEFVDEDVKTTYFKITAIEDGVFKNGTFAEVVIGKYVESIGKNAFRGCAKLKQITIKTDKLTKKSVGENAFKGIADHATVKCPKKMLKTYKKILRSAGVPKNAEFIK